MDCKVTITAYSGDTLVSCREMDINDYYDSDIPEIDKTLDVPTVDYTGYQFDAVWPAVEYRNKIETIDIPEGEGYYDISWDDAIVENLPEDWVLDDIIKERHPSQGQVLWLMAEDL